LSVTQLRPGVRAGQSSIRETPKERTGRLDHPMKMMGKVGATGGAVSRA